MLSVDGSLRFKVFSWFGSDGDLQQVVLEYDFNARLIDRAVPS